VTLLPWSSRCIGFHDAPSKTIRTRTLDFFRDPNRFSLAAIPKSPPPATLGFEHFFPHGSGCRCQGKGGMPPPGPPRGMMGGYPGYPTGPPGFPPGPMPPMPPVPQAAPAGYPPPGTPARPVDRCHLGPVPTGPMPFPPGSRPLGASSQPCVRPREPRSKITRAFRPRFIPSPSIAEILFPSAIADSHFFCNRLSKNVPTEPRLDNPRRNLPNIYINASRIHDRYQYRAAGAGAAGGGGGVGHWTGQIRW